MKEKLKPRRLWFQFTLRQMFLAITWASLFCTGLVLVVRLNNHELVALEWEMIAYLFVYPLLIVPIPALIGVLAGRPKTGFLLGLGIFIAGICYLSAVLAVVPI